MNTYFLYIKYFYVPPHIFGLSSEIRNTYNIVVQITTASKSSAIVVNLLMQRISDR